MRPPHRRPHRFSAHPQIDTRATSPTILGVLAVSPEPSVKMRALWIRHAHTGCLHPRTHPADASAAWRRSPHMAVEPQPRPRSPRGCRSRSGRTRRRDPICRRGSLIRRARNRRRQSPAGRLAGPWRESNPLRSAAPAKRPRRMGLCSEVADGGENLEDHPALATRYVRRKAPFQRANCPASWSRAALNLFHSVQTKSCLGHCITRGIGLRRQATIFRLRGAVLFSRAEARPAREFGRARGVEILMREDFCRALRGEGVCSAWNHGTLRFHSRYCRGVRSSRHELTPRLAMDRLRRAEESMRVELKQRQRAQLAS